MHINLSPSKPKAIANVVLKDVIVNLFSRKFNGLSLKRKGLAPSSSEASAKYLKTNEQHLCINNRVTNNWDLVSPDSWDLISSVEKEELEVESNTRQPRYIKKFKSKFLGNYVKLLDPHNLVEVKVSKDFAFRKKTITYPNLVVVEILEEGEEIDGLSKFKTQRVVVADPV